MWLLLVLLVGSFGITLLYVQMASLSWTEQERRELIQAELSLGILLEQIRDPQIQKLMRDRDSRRLLFKRFAGCIRADIFKLARIRSLTFQAIPLVGLFLVSYYVLRFKALFQAWPTDLNYLSGLELAIYRSLTK